MTNGTLHAITDPDRSGRVTILHQIGAVADDVLSLKDRRAAEILARSLAGIVATSPRDPETWRAELVTLAAYALAAVEHLDIEARK